MCITSTQLPDLTAPSVSISDDMELGSSFDSISRIVNRIPTTPSPTEQIKLLNRLKRKVSRIDLAAIPAPWRQTITKITDWASNVYFETQKSLIQQEMDNLPSFPLPPGLVPETGIYLIAEEFRHPALKELILTGRVKKLPLKDPSETLQNNLLLGQHIIAHARGKIPYSPNHLIRSYHHVASSLSDRQLVHTIADITERIISITRSHIANPEDADSLQDPEDDDFLQDPLHEHSNRIALLTAAKVGNCGELALLGYFHAVHELNTPTSIHLAFVPDHEFLIIDDMDSPNAVVCDPWSGSCYPKTEIEHYLRDYKNSFEDLCPIVTPIDPSEINLVPSSDPALHSFNINYFKQGNLDKVRAILDKDPEYVKERFPDLLQISIDNAQWDIVALLLEKELPPDTPTILLQELPIALTQACIDNKASDALAEKILKQICDIDIIPDMEYEKALHLLNKSSHTDCNRFRQQLLQRISASLIPS